MKLYFKLIGYTQNIMLAAGILLLILLPPALVFFPDVTYTYTGLLYDLAHYSLLFVMCVRPLADIFTQTRWIRPLVILRKGFGVFSASIIVSFMLSKIAFDPISFFGSFFSLQYWSLEKLSVFAHVADMAAIILLVTSNKLSKQVLGKWWKRIQRLSYVYFYASSIYLLIQFGKLSMFIFIAIVTHLTLWAYFKNRARRREKAAAVASTKTFTPNPASMKAI